MDYSEYISSPEWRAKRLEVATKANFTCNRTYRNFGHEPLSDLEFLCPGCHKKLHEKRDKQRCNPRRKRKTAIVCVPYATRNVHICAKIMCAAILGKQKTRLGTQTPTKPMKNALRLLQDKRNGLQKITKVRASVKPSNYDVE